MTKKTARKTRTKQVKAIRLPRSVKRLFPQVEFAVDATKAVEVSVNKADCDNAIALNPMECALARATKREKHADAVIIGMSSSYIIKGKQAVRFATPESVSREIVSFDRHHDFAPGHYALIPKSPTAKFGSSYQRDNYNKNRDRTNEKEARRKVHHSVRVRVLPKGIEADKD